MAHAEKVDIMDGIEHIVAQGAPDLSAVPQPPTPEIPLPPPPTRHYISPGTPESPDARTPDRYYTGELPRRPTREERPHAVTAPET